MTYNIWAVRGNRPNGIIVPMKVYFDDYIPPNHELDAMAHLNTYQSFILKQIKVPKSDIGWRWDKNDGSKKTNVK